MNLSSHKGFQQERMIHPSVSNEILRWLVNLTDVTAPVKCTSVKLVNGVHVKPRLDSSI